MSKCLNCGVQISCGCQKRIASDGKNTCNSCLTAYEASIKQPKPEPINVTNQSVIFKR